MKACCIRTIAELDVAVRAGVSIAGFVSKMKATNALSDAQIAKLAGRVKPPVVPILVTREVTARGIREHVERTNTTAVQLVRAIADDELRQLRELSPGLRIVRVAYIAGEESIGPAVARSELADMLLLDTAHGHATQEQLGNTGKPHDWSVSRRIRDTADCPVMLAGGLSPANLEEAIETVRPFAVDVCTGVRDSNNKLVEERIQRFVEIASSFEAFEPANRHRWNRP